MPGSYGLGRLSLRCLNSRVRALMLAFTWRVGGDVGLITPRTHLVTRIILIINILSKSPRPPTSRVNWLHGEPAALRI